ncbi:MAG: hypothetical protein NTW48_06990 [Chloroflexi bacterium]|nr:hypothetical protein [Chloroflexota bacterium]
MSRKKTPPEIRMKILGDIIGHPSSNLTVYRKKQDHLEYAVTVYQHQKRIEESRGQDRAFF